MTVADPAAIPAPRRATTAEKGQWALIYRRFRRHLELRMAAAVGHGRRGLHGAILVEQEPHLHNQFLRFGDTGGRIPASLDLPA